MIELSRYSLNTLKEAKEYARQKEKEGCKNVHIQPLYRDGAEVGHTVLWRKE